MSQADQTPAASSSRPKGHVRAFHVKTATVESVREILLTNVSRKSDLHTDESRLYVKVGREFASPKTVIHGPNAQGEFIGADGQTTSAGEGTEKEGESARLSLAASLHKW
jgi:hypothetical protein